MPHSNASAEGRCKRRCQPGLHLVSQPDPTDTRRDQEAADNQPSRLVEEKESRNMGSLASQTPPVSADDDWCLLNGRRSTLGAPSAQLGA